MENILLPTKVSVEEGATPREAQLVVEPCFHGYGTTAGNALRRVLLSSLVGAAVTAVKIKGVTHEFQAIPGVKEDVLQIILNLKQLRVRLHTDEPVKLMLRATGEGEVTGASIEPNAEVEVVNPAHVLCTMTEAKAGLEMEITVEKGRGFRPTEKVRKGGEDLGTIAVDALFSPVRNVSYRVEATRVGEITDYDKLIMTIETDGTISPKDAVRDSTKILMDYFTTVSNGLGETEATS
ncbi:DNA-directed RNA polymerase subunit alpha [Candidatus Uhrbacteria bacterium]|nr:DNA-directed RNA polymerase subunit alpha [Candidatus Uhrbacteria bacterium]